MYNETLEIPFTQVQILQMQFNGQIAGLDDEGGKDFFDLEVFTDQVIDTWDWLSILLKPGDVGPTTDQEKEKRLLENLEAKQARLAEEELRIARIYGYNTAEEAWIAAEKNPVIRGQLNSLNG